MKFWIDGEWNDFRGDLISMALVGEDGSEWYEVLECLSPKPWIARNVIPNLGRPAVSLSHMQVSLVEYLRTFDSVHIVSDWPEDIERFCALLITGPGERIDTPPLTFEIDRNLNSNESLVPHNALCDARALRGKHVGR